MTDHGDTSPEPATDSDTSMSSNSDVQHTARETYQEVVLEPAPESPESMAEESKEVDLGDEGARDDWFMPDSTVASNFEEPRRADSNVRRISVGTDFTPTTLPVEGASNHDENASSSSSSSYLPESLLSQRHETIQQRPAEDSAEESRPESEEAVISARGTANSLKNMQEVETTSDDENDLLPIQDEPLLPAAQEQTSNATPPESLALRVSLEEPSKADDSTYDDPRQHALPTTATESPPPFVPDDYLFFTSDRPDSADPADPAPVVSAGSLDDAPEVFEEQITFPSRRASQKDFEDFFRHRVKEVSTKELKGQRGLNVYNDDDDSDHGSSEQESNRRSTHGREPPDTDDEPFSSKRMIERVLAMESDSSEDSTTHTPENEAYRRELQKQHRRVSIRNLEQMEANVDDSKNHFHRTERRKGIKALVAMTPNAAEGSNFPSPTSSSSTESSSRLLRGFEALLGALLQLSDELELWSLFGRTPDRTGAIVSADAIKSVLRHAPALNQLLSRVNPVLEHFLETGLDPDSEIEALMTRAHRLVQLLCELTHRVCQRQEWNNRAETAFVTLLELMDRTTTEITCLHEGISVPEFQMSSRHRRAWVATGHVEELKALFVPPDRGMQFFQQLCYDVLISTDSWCPSTHILGLVCNVGPGQKEDSPPPPESRLAPIPLSALYVLDNIQGEPLPRTATMTRILRRILPSYAIMDPNIVPTAFRVSHSHSSTSGARNVVAVSSTAEFLNDPESMGLAGVGKSTAAAMVASHEDVRRHYKDGVIWIHIGSQEMTYRRYTQCLRELCSQLVFYDGIPLFAELLHTPGEAQAARTRREEGFMIYARDAVAELLRMRHILIILDDVCFESDIEWFQFGPDASPRKGGSSVTSSSGEGSCCILITTRYRDLLSDVNTVEIDLLDVDDAMRLFVTESGHKPDHEIGYSLEARSVVMECANHPLAVKTVGRWLRLKQVTSGVIRSVEEIYKDVGRVSGSKIDELVRTGMLEEADMMYEIMNMSLSPFVNGEPTVVIKFCFAAFVTVFCHEEHHSNSLSHGTVVRPIIPMETADLLFQTLLALEEDLLFQEGSPFFTKQKEATLLIPEALSALGVLKVISSAEDAIPEHASRDWSRNSGTEHKYLQIVHAIQHEYGEYLSNEGNKLQSLTQDGEIRWNREFAKACVASSGKWDMDATVASRDYAVEMLVSHMLRGELYEEAAAILSDERYVRGRLYSLGPENATRRHIADCEMLFQKLKEKQVESLYNREPQVYMEWAYRQLCTVISTEISDTDLEEGRILTIEAGRANFEMGFSLAEKRCWKPAIYHWGLSQKLLVSSLGMVEFVAAILFNTGVALSQLNEYDRAMASLKQCLRIRGALHGEEHLLYAQTIQKIGDVFLQMSDFDQALESYDWAMEIVTIHSHSHRVDIGEILDSIGDLHYMKGEIREALKYFEDALDSKQSQLGNDDPELAITFQHIGNCLSDQGRIEEAVYNFEEAIRLMNLDPNGGDERDAHVLSLRGVLLNLNGMQEEGLKCYEKSLEVLMSSAPHKKKKIADLLHLIGCVYLINGEHIKAMKLFEESLQTRRKMMGFVHLDVASTLFNMAFLHQMRAHPKKALKCLEEALKIRQLRLPDSEKVAVTHEKIGTLAKALRKRQKAEIAFEEALRIRIMIYGKDHESVGSLYHELGDLMDEFGDYEEAVAYYAEALDIRRKRLGDDHEAVASILYSMGFAMFNADKLESALHCFDEALIIWKSRLGVNSKEVGDTLNMMGFLNAKRGQFVDALTLLLDAHSIRKQQNDSVKISETLMNVGNVHRETHELELAMACYTDCLQLRRSQLGDDHEKVADALIAIGNAQSDMERMEDALKSYEEALAIRSMIFGDHDEKVAKVFQHMGMIEFRFGDLHRGRQLLEEFVRIRRKNGTTSDGEFVNVLFVIGNIHKIDGERYYAQKNWTEAYNIAQDLGITKRSPELGQAMGRLLQAGEIPSVAHVPHLIPDGSDHKILRKFKLSTVKESLQDEKLPPHPRGNRSDNIRRKSDLTGKRKHVH